MEKMQLLKRLHRLEEEIQLFKEDLAPTTKRNKFITGFQKLGKFIISNWILLSFIVAVATAVYVKFVFDVDYFENYRNISTTQKLSDFYRQLGERMMACSEWKAAEDAYRSALEINQNNIRATYGVLKARVFQPLEGEKYYAPEVVDVKLDYLLSSFPDDYEIYFLKALRYQAQGYNKDAMSWYKKTIDKAPKFTGSYLNLGYIHMGSYDAEKNTWHVDMDKATSNFKKAVELDPNYPLANNNLGFCYIINGNFEEAVKHLLKSYSVSPHLLTALNLGDAYRYSGDFNSALIWHKHALDIIKEPGIEKERYMGGNWKYNYMPLEPGDLETIKNYVIVSTIDEKKAFVYYALSFDYVLVENFDAANEQLEVALQLDKNRQYRSLFRYRIRSIENFLEINDNVKLQLSILRLKLLSE